MRPDLKRAIDSIRRHREGLPGAVPDEAALLSLVERIGQANLADRLYDDIPHTVPFGLVCDLFDLLAWRTDDNGASMMRTAERWLMEGAEERKLLIALHLEAYPFISDEDMEEVLLRVGKNDPRVADRCTELIKQRNGTKRSAG